MMGFLCNSMPGAGIEPAWIFSPRDFKSVNVRTRTRRSTDAVHSSALRIHTYAPEPLANPLHAKFPFPPPRAARLTGVR